MLQQLSVYVTAGVSIYYSRCQYMLQQVSVYATAFVSIFYSSCQYSLQHLSVYFTAVVGICYSRWNSNFAALQSAFCCTGHFWTFLEICQHKLNYFYTTCWQPLTAIQTGTVGLCSAALLYRNCLKMISHAYRSMLQGENLLWFCTDCASVTEA